MSDTQIKYFTIPNLITLLNLFSGSLAIFIAFESPDNLIVSAYLIGISAILDFLDGFTARLLGAYSEIGKQLDSLADLVSFGVAPTAILFQMMQEALKVKNVSPNLPLSDTLFLASVAIIVMFSALRLAKFNIDTTQTTSFKGLATPAVAMFIASLPIISELDPSELIFYYALDGIDDFMKAAFEIRTSLSFGFMLRFLGIPLIIFKNEYFFLPIILILSYLMICDLPMFSLKFKEYSWRNNKTKYIFLGTSLIFIILLQSLAIPLIIIAYIITSLITLLAGKAKAANLPIEIEEQNIKARNGNSNNILIIEKDLKTEFKLFE